MRTFLITSLIMILLFTSAICETVVFGDHLKVAYGNECITLREEPSSDSIALASVPLNSEVTWLYQDCGGFSYVLFDGKAGYVASKYLEVLPEESIPDDITLLKETDSYRQPNPDLGCLYIIDVADYFPVLDKMYGSRTFLLPGDEVVMLEKGEETSVVEFESLRYEVPNEILLLKNEYCQWPIGLTRTEQYRLNAFFSSLSESKYVFPYEAAYSAERSTDRELLVKFALDHLKLNYPELLKHADNDSWGGYTAVIESGCIDAIIDKYFNNNSNDYDEENWYDSLYHENIKEYYFVYTGESWSELKGYNSQVDAVNALGNDRYAVRFHTQGENGFSIIHAPDGFESSRDWTVEYYTVS